MNCAQVGEYLRSDIKLSPVLEDELARHLDACRSCELQLALAEKQLADVLRRAIRATPAEGETAAIAASLLGVRERVMADIEKERELRRRSRDLQYFGAAHTHPSRTSAHEASTHTTWPRAIASLEQEQRRLTEEYLEAKNRFIHWELAWRDDFPSRTGRTATAHRTFVVCGFISLVAAVLLSTWLFAKFWSIADPKFSWITAGASACVAGFAYLGMRAVWRIGVTRPAITWLRILRCVEASVLSVLLVALFAAGLRLTSLSSRVQLAFTVLSVGAAGLFTVAANLFCGVELLGRSRSLSREYEKLRADLSMGRMMLRESRHRHANRIDGKDCVRCGLPANASTYAWRRHRSGGVGGQVTASNAATRAEADVT
jgi:hypothetical protein